MKKLLVTLFVLAFAAIAVAQQPPAGAPPAGQTQAGQGGQTKEPEFTNPAEYNAYVSAIQTADPAAKIQALEDFLTRYPNSVAKEPALEQLIAAYQATSNIPKALDAAQRLLQVNANSLVALGTLAYQSRALAEANQNPQQNIPNARTYGERGLQALQAATKPPFMADATWQQLKTQTPIIFNGAVGFAALNSKDYPTAQKYLKEAVELALQVNPNSRSAGDVLALGLADLEPSPINPEGLFWIARAAALTNNNPQILAYGKAKYKNYHGGDDGWDAVLQYAASHPSPGPDFQALIPPAPSLADQAEALAKSKPVAQMNIGDWEMILENATPATRDRVWADMKAMPPVQFRAWVLQADKDKLMLAGTPDALTAGKPDVQLNMAAPLPKTMIPKADPQRDIMLEGKISSYQTSPSFLLVMDEGKLVKEKTTKPPIKGPARKGRRK